MFKYLRNNKNSGFSIPEIIVVVTILGILSTVVVSNFYLISKRTEVANSVQELANVLRLAQNKTLSSEGNSQYGVYLDTTTTPDRYILFKGTSYLTRDPAFDQIYNLTNKVEFYAISLGGGSEIVFNKFNGDTNQSGNVTLRSISDASESKTLYITSSGAIHFTSVPTVSDNTRIKDSRHIHFDYSRIIITGTENITLNFDNGVVIETFPINSYLTGGQIEWSKTVSVGGSDQTVRIRTHRLNNLDTQFSIHRDGRLNNKSLKITISGDASGNLIDYSANGLTVNGVTTVNCSSGASGLSIYISNCSWQ